MEAPDRPARDRLTLLRAIAHEPHAYGFYHVARLIECAYPGRRPGWAPRAACAKIRCVSVRRPRSDLRCPPWRRWSCTEGASPRLLVRFTGLTGPNGPLPLHLTEFARDRLRNHGDRTFLRFLDTFHHRFFTMFYRAWADAQPTVSLDRPDQDPFGDRLGALAGYGVAGPAGPRRGARVFQACPHRSAGQQCAQRRRPGTHRRQLLSGAGPHRPVAAPLDEAAARCPDPHRPGPGERPPGRHGSDRLQGLGLPEPLPHRHRPDAPGAVRAFSSRASPAW